MTCCKPLLDLNAKLFPPIWNELVIVTSFVWNSCFSTQPCNDVIFFIPNVNAMQTRWFWNLTAIFLLIKILCCKRTLLVSSILISYCFCASNFSGNKSHFSMKRQPIRGVGVVVETANILCVLFWFPSFRVSFLVEVIQSQCGLGSRVQNSENYKYGWRKEDCYYI